MKWIESNTNNGYKMMKLFEIKWLRFDCTLIYYPKNSKSETHLDIVKGYNNTHLNIVLREAKVGGEFFLFWSEKKKYRIIKFRPDTHPHGVLPVKEGFRLVLSFGWLRRVKCP